jgi:translation initiation factor 3 subunit B
MFALTAMHGHPFDAKHTFKVNLFTDVERFADLDETYVEPKLEEYKAKVQMSFACICTHY